MPVLHVPIPSAATIASVTEMMLARLGDPAPTTGTVAINALQKRFFEGKEIDVDDLIAELTGNTEHLADLWMSIQNGQLQEAHLNILFSTAQVQMSAKSNTARTVVQVMEKLCGPANVSSFCDYETASDALKSADVAFVDFYLNNNDNEADALDKISNESERLAGPKLLFFMSSVANLDTQRKVRAKIRRKSGFFDVMEKQSITAELLQAKLHLKAVSYRSNLSIKSIIEQAITAARESVDYFEHKCEELEAHDLRLLSRS